MFSLRCLLNTQVDLSARQQRDDCVWNSGAKSARDVHLRDVWEQMTFQAMRLVRPCWGRVKLEVKAEKGRDPRKGWGLSSRAFDVYMLIGFRKEVGQSGWCGWGTTNRECSPENHEKKVFPDFYTMNPVPTRNLSVLPGTYIQNVTSDHQPQLSNALQVTTNSLWDNCKGLHLDSLFPPWLPQQPLFHSAGSVTLSKGKAEHTHYLFKVADRSIKWVLSVDHLICPERASHWYPGVEQFRWMCGGESTVKWGQKLKNESKHKHIWRCSTSSVLREVQIVWAQRAFTLHTHKTGYVRLKIPSITVELVLS